MVCNGFKKLEDYFFPTWKFGGLPLQSSQGPSSSFSLVILLSLGYCPHFLTMMVHSHTHISASGKKEGNLGGSVGLRVQLLISVQVMSSQAPCGALCWQQRAWLGFSFSPSLSALSPLSLSLKINKHKKKRENPGRGTKHKRFLNIENKLRVAGGVVSWAMAKWARGIGEDTYWEEHWVLYVEDESLDSAPEIIIALYSN